MLFYRYKKRKKRSKICLYMLNGSILKYKNGEIFTAYLSYNDLYKKHIVEYTYICSQMHTDHCIIDVENDPSILNDLYNNGKYLPFLFNVHYDNIKMRQIYRNYIRGII